MVRVVLLAGVGLALGSNCRADDAENRAIAFVEKLGGKAERADGKPDGPVIVVDLHDSKITDEGLKELAAFRSLTALYLFDTTITDGGLKELTVHKNLEKLFLGRTRITDAGLKQVAKLTRLTTLFLDGTAITDAGLKELVPLQSLTILMLHSTKTTGGGLKEIARLKNLQTLYFGAKASAPELKQLSAIMGLRGRLETDLFLDSGERLPSPHEYHRTDAILE